MTRHWAAACGLLTDDNRIRQRATELLQDNQATAARFGHQSTISKLLSMTPELGLSKGLQAVWVRKPVPKCLPAQVVGKTVTNFYPDASSLNLFNRRG